jgi:hypothetical protein
LHPRKSSDRLDSGHARVYAAAITERILRKKLEQTARSVLPNKTRANNS